MQNKEISNDDNNNKELQMNSQELIKETKSPSSKDIQKNINILDPAQNTIISNKIKIPKNEEENIIRPSAYSSTQKNKKRFIEENKEISEFTTNKKLRNTISGLNNNKLKFQSGLIDVILKVERENVNHYLKGDLAEMYKDITMNNINFKNNVFLANIDYFEKKTGILDKNPIRPYNCSEDISFKLGKYPTTNEIIDKFTERTKNYQGEL